ncbi:MAG: hypothetical protein GWP91_25280 [Rhodobacterales bacterium]|nr:hypothetical protein [Rhodobacterales bacterium]
MGSGTRKAYYDHGGYTAGVCSSIPYAGHRGTDLRPGSFPGRDGAVTEPSDMSAPRTQGTTTNTWRFDAGVPASTPKPAARSTRQ